MNDATPITKRDLVEQNIDKVFPNGSLSGEEAASPSAVPATRPTFGVSTVEMDASKMMAMGAPITPVWLRANPGACWHIIQLSKQWTKFDARTNSWVHYSPTVICQNMFVVKSEKTGEENVGYTSMFIAALIDSFGPLKSHLRFTYSGEGQQRRCKVEATLRGEQEPHSYETPQLGTITPKRSPLWQSDPDRQLAYYARRAWARLYTPGVLLGVYDVEEVAEFRGPEKAKDVSPGLRLAERLDKHREGNGEPEEGFGKAAELGTHAPAASGGGKAAPRKEGAPAAAAALPKGPTQYRDHLDAWLPLCKTEEQVEARWRDESKLRKACRISDGVKANLRLLVDQRIVDIRAATAQA